VNEQHVSWLYVAVANEQHLSWLYVAMANEQHLSWLYVAVARYLEGEFEVLLGGLEVAHVHGQHGEGEGRLGVVTVTPDQQLEPGTRGQYIVVTATL